MCRSCCFVPFGLLTFHCRGDRKADRETESERTRKWERERERDAATERTCVLLNVLVRVSEALINQFKSLCVRLSQQCQQFIPSLCLSVDQTLNSLLCLNSVESCVRPIIKNRRFSLETNTITNLFSYPLKFRKNKLVEPLFVDRYSDFSTLFFFIQIHWFSSLVNFFCQIFTTSKNCHSMWKC